jgi:hypothetical protein
LIRQENSDIVFPPISAKNAEMDGAPQDSPPSREVLQEKRLVEPVHYDFRMHSKLLAERAVER